VALTTVVANNCGARRRRKREHWVHPHIAEEVLISPFSLLSLAMQRHSYYLHNIHANNRTSEQSSPLSEQVRR
jgi:hypothetical protein